MYQSPFFDLFDSSVPTFGSAPPITPKKPLMVDTTAPVDPIMAMVTQLLAPRPTMTRGGIPWHELIQSTLPGAGDVQGMANKMSQLPSYMPGSTSPFNTGFFDVNRSSFGLTPEAKLASQGPSAQTQWGALGGVAGVDSGVLRGLLNARKQSMGSY